MDTEEYRDIYTKRVANLCEKISKSVQEIALHMNPTTREVMGAYATLLLGLMIDEGMEEKHVKLIFEGLLKEFCLKIRENKK